MLNCHLERTTGICWERFGVRDPLAVITMEMVMGTCVLQILSMHRDIRYSGSRSVFLIRELYGENLAQSDTEIIAFNGV